MRQRNRINYPFFSGFADHAQTSFPIEMKFAEGIVQMITTHKIMTQPTTIAAVKLDLASTLIFVDKLPDFTLMQ